MRYLLLLLLSVLIPLQSLAAMAQSQPHVGPHISAQPVSAVSAPAVPACAVAQPAAPPEGLAAAAYQADVSDHGMPADDDDTSCAQADLEDPSLPARIATPQAHWQPFPHAFMAPLSWPSYLRDQLRPPPLA